MDSNEIHFFGAVDKNKRGVVGSTMPAWALHAQVDELKEGINSKQRELGKGYMDAEAKLKCQESLLKEKGRLDEIESSKPELTDVERDRVAKGYKSLSKEFIN